MRNKNGNRNTPAMPLRRGHQQVELVHMPGDPRQKLGVRYSATDNDTGVRTQSILQWSQTASSPRPTTDEAAPIEAELDQRTSTVLSYEVPREVSDQLNGMHGESKNTGRAAGNDSSGIKVTLGFKP